MDLTGRNALVTGAAHRVGRALTLALAGAGVNVFVHYNSSAGPAEATAGEALTMGVRADIGSADLSDPRAGLPLLEAAESALGPISILINSASGFPEDRLQDVALDQWQAAHNLTLAGPVFLTQAFANALPPDLDGAVLNVTDVNTATPNLEHFSYIVAKGGLDTFTKAAALALAPRIRVNAVALGVILPPPGRGADYAERLGNSVPMRRPGGTAPVAAAALALLENDYVTGEIVRVDGGKHLT